MQDLRVGGPNGLQAVGLLCECGERRFDEDITFWFAKVLYSEMVREGIAFEQLWNRESEREGMGNQQERVVTRCHTRPRHKAGAGVRARVLLLCDRPG